MNIINSEEKLSEIIQNDDFMMNVLLAAEKLNLRDWWIGAGFLRNKVWDYIQGNKPTTPKDIDLVFYDNSNNSMEFDWKISEKMNKKYPFAEWEVRNQARMHYYNNFDPYTSTADGISHWVETATCVAVKISKGTLTYLFCYGTDDLFKLIARPTPYFKSDRLIHVFHDRLREKKWQQKWPSLKVIE